MSPETFTWMALAVTSGAFIQGSTGMGFALIVAPVVGIFDPSLLPVSLLILMLPLNAHIAWRERDSIDLIGTKWISIGRILGTFGGLWILVMIPLNYLNILIGISTITASIASMLAPSFSPGKRAFVFTGVITGITETATGIGGPPLALVYQHLPVATLRASVAICFLIGEIVSLIVLTASGKVELTQVTPAFLLLPALLLGMLSSHFVHKSVNDRFLRNFVMLFAITSGTYLLVN